MYVHLQYFTLILQTTVVCLTSLINIVAEQTIERAKHLPKGMVQRVVIDVRGQRYKQIDLDDISDKIMKKSNGTIKLENIEFLENE